MIVIRPARAKDAEAIAAIYAPYVEREIISFEIEAPDARAIAARMAASNGYFPWLVAAAGEEEDARILGYAYAGRFRDRPAYDYVVETSIYLDQEAKGFGTGRLLYDALIDTLRAQGFTQAIGVISLPNDQSIALHRAVGFRSAGMHRAVGFKFGRWIDVGFWQCELNESAIPPREPRPFREVGMVRN